MAKLRLTFKDPDGPCDAIREEAKRQVAAFECADDDERDAFTAKREETIHKKISKWLRHGEYLAVDIDLETGAATVVPAKEEI